MTGNPLSLQSQAQRESRSQSVIEVEALVFRYRGQSSAPLVVGHLALAPGERLFVHGPSGRGKSTLMSLLAGVLVADRGRVALLGTDWKALRAGDRDSRRGNHVGYVFQQFNLLTWMPVLDNVCLPCRFSTRRATRAVQRSGSIERDAARWLDALGIGQARHHQDAGTLSVGEQQRVAAARALIGTPDLLLADEPTSALDSNRRDEFVGLLLSACEEAGSALVFVSHDRTLETHFDRSLALEKGG